MIVYYCSQCGTQIPEEDVDSGRAKTADDLSVQCAKCSGGKSASASQPITRKTPTKVVAKIPSNRDAIVAARRTPSKANARVTPNRGVSSSRKSSPQAPVIGDTASRGSTAILLSFGGIFVALLLGALYFSSRPTVKTPPPEDIKDPNAAAVLLPEPPPQKGDEDPRSLASKAMLEQVKTFSKTNPEKLFEYRVLLEDLIDRYSGSKAAEEADKLLAEWAKLPTDPNLAKPEDWSKAINLMELVKPDEDSVNGKWKLENGALYSQPINGTKILFRYTPPPEYDVRVVFKRVQGTETIGIVGRRDTKNFCLLIGGWGNQLSGLERIKYRRVTDNDAKFPFKNIIRNGRTYTMILQVRGNEIRGYLNNQLIAKTNAPSSDLDLNDDWRTPSPERLAINSWSNIYEVSKVEVLEVTGKGTVLTDVAPQPADQK